jgi:HTH-type transcriptional regulator/antitoxin HipB
MPSPKNAKRRPTKTSKQPSTGWRNINKHNRRHMSRHRRFEDVLRDKLKNQKFKKEWEATELQYQVIEAIIAERLKRNMTQEELAEKAGLKQPNLARVESGSVAPSITTLSKIAKAFGKNWQFQLT